MDKYNRNYTLSVQVPTGELITIERPFTLDFDITRNILSSANVASFRLYNLAEKTRNLIRKDQFDYATLKQVSLRAGYGKNLPIIFSGNINQAWSVRESVDFVTQIESYDGGFAFANGLTNKSFPAGTPQEAMISSLMDDLPNVSKGAIGSYPGKTTRGNSYSGSTTDILREVTGGGFFIDNNKANALGDSEALEGELAVINSQNGLLGTPVREQTYLNFDMLFEPRLIIGQKIRLESITGANFNGYYKVISIRHKGLISESVAGDAITSVGLFYGVNQLQTVAAVNG